jgi:NADPH2:quinone reductase
MRAVVARAAGGPEVLRLQNVEAPTPGPGEVAIEVAYAGVNFAEVMGRRGLMPNARPPFVPGLEVSGTVRSLGEGVTSFAPGDAVCAFTAVGGYAEVAVARAALTFELPDASDATLRRAATYPTIVPTAWALVHDAARVREGEDVLVSAAAGGLGTVIAQVAGLSGAGHVYGVVSSEAKGAYAMEFGYDGVFVGESWPDDLGLATAGAGVDVVFDSVGGSFRDQAFAALAPMGRLAIFGIASGAAEHAPDAFALRTQCKATVGFSISGLAQLDAERLRRIAGEALGAAHDGLIQVAITEEFELADVRAAHAEIEARRSVGKYVLAVSTGS